MDNTEFRVATVVAAGTIGLGWVTLFLSHGLRVRVVSRRADAAEQVVSALRLHLRSVPGLCSTDEAELRARLDVGDDLERALRDADVVQENAPEVLATKQEIFARVEAAAPPEALLLSSTSSLLPDDIGASMRDPGRVIVGHPFNPPYLVPLVEVLGGGHTAVGLVERAVRFYRQVGRTAVVLRRPIAGFVANRLQSALLRECIHLVREGVVTVDELDKVVTESVGPRWAAIGPFQAFHLGGGPGGLRHWLSHLGAGLEAGWAQLGRPRMDDDTIRLLLEQADLAFAGSSYEELSTRRDRLQHAILTARSAPDAAGTDG